MQHAACSLRNRKSETRKQRNKRAIEPTDLGATATDQPSNPNPIFGVMIDRAASDARHIPEETTTDARQTTKKGLHGSCFVLFIAINFNVAALMHALYACT